MTGDATVFVVDDDEAMRHSLSWLLQSVGHRVECFASAEAFLAAYDPDRAGCLVLDVRMPGMSGLELQQHLADRGAALPVIVITGHGDVPMAVRAMRAGAVDFIEKPLNNQALIERVGAALRSSLAQRAEQAQLRQIRTRLGSLSTREREVAVAVAEGKQNKVIAFDLGISQKTVEVHRRNAMEKMGASSAADLARMLEKAGQ
jgi:two-component system response regulator FixJ